MRYGSVCSGIEAASVAWHPLGWTPAWFAEIEAFPAAVLDHRWPGVPNVGDFTRIGKDVEVEPVELVVGGTPCQSFSVAGKRLGLDDPRGNLTLEFIALVGRLRPRWVVWENVPGVLSDDGGRTFGTVLGLLGKLGYGLAYRVLDAQFFGVPQRRRRVFVVGHLGAWQRAAAVLLEPSCLSGNPPPRRETREGVAASLTKGAESGRRREDDVNLVTSPPVLASGRGFERAGDSRGQDCVVAMNAHGGSHGRIDAESETFVAHSLRADGFDASEDGTGRGTAHSTEPAVAHDMTVRRLTPRECERLQGFPDDYTAITYKGKPAADGPRYRALGNSMAVPCMAWIGERIQMMEQSA
jgi:DNA (cytosine-5)-methyltransferase 1